MDSLGSDETRTAIREIDRYVSIDIVYKAIFEGKRDGNDDLDGDDYVKKNVNDR